MNDSTLPASLFTIGRKQHRVIGLQIRLRFADDFELRFTPSEASSLSLALVAVSRGISPEREIYMSPSDDAFVGKVLEAGMSIGLRDGDMTMDWPAVEQLASALAAAIG